MLGRPEQQEFIGLQALAVHRTLAHKARGIIRDETKNTVILECAGRRMTLPKKGLVLHIEFPEGTMKVKGTRIMFRPEDRIKRAKKGR